MDQWGLSSHLATVHNMANLLLSAQLKTLSPVIVDKKWVCRFVDCHKKLQSKYNHKYNYQQA